MKMNRIKYLAITVIMVLSFGDAVSASTNKTEITVISITGNKLTYMETATDSETMGTDSETPGTELQKDYQSKSGNRMPGGFSKNKPDNLKTIYLPVAVPVHIGEEETRTFTIIQAGDTFDASFVMDEDGEEVITELWLKNVNGDN